jgi:uncharacterized protein YbjQ (UPF0145 family)
MQMRVNVLLVTIPLVLAISGCANPVVNPAVGSLSTDQYARFKAMEVSRESATRPHTILSSVQGLSCSAAKQLGAPQNPVSEEEAMEGLKLRAALLDADAVVNVVCKTSGVDWVNACTSSIICAGDAIRYNP